MSVVISISICSTNVTIAPCTPNYMGCQNYYNFVASADYVVNVNVTADIYWYGDLGGVQQGSVTILGGQSCNSTSVYTNNINCMGEYVSYVDTILTPLSSGSQSYGPGIPTYNSCPC